MVTLNRWLSVRLEMLEQGVILGAAVLVACSSGGSGSGSSKSSSSRSAPPPDSPPDSSAGLAGLALTSAISLMGLLNWMVRKATEREVNINVVERVAEYCAEKTEAPFYSHPSSSSSSSSSPSSLAGWSRLHPRTGPARGLSRSAT